MRRVQDAQIKDKNVLVRIDADVPLKMQNANRKMQNVTIIDDSRIRAAVPTIKYLLENGAKVTLIGHIDRPGGKEIPELKMRPVEDKLIELLGTHQNWQILENLRFNPGEEKNESEFAGQLASGQDLFVQDAFATCHRKHASTVGVAKLSPSYAGLAVQKEVENLSKLLANPDRPFITVIGGAKIEDKKPVINGLLPKADKILVGGIVANKLQKDKEQLSSKIVLPVDGRPELIGLDIGPKTIEIFKKIIDEAKTIFWAGPLGKYEEPKYARGTKEIARTIADAKALTFVGGGDTGSFLNQNNLEAQFDFISAGGGAALEFLSGKKLPGLEVLES